jgi:hypothetical protein
MIHVPDERPFVRRISECMNLPYPTGGACPTANLKGLDESIEEAMGYISKHTPLKSSLGGLYRKPPLSISMLPRGGKTTFLMMLFDKLKNSGYAPILITLNVSAKFSVRENETDEQALTRMIATQLVDLTDEDIPLNICCDKTALKHHIDKTSDSKPVVLLIDELNQVFGRPLDYSGGSLLQEMFLAPSDRYLVFSTHFPMDLMLGDAIKIDSKWTTKHLQRLPRENDVGKLQEMPGCSTVTPMVATLVHMIPSLVFITSTTSGVMELYNNVQTRAEVFIPRDMEKRHALLCKFVPAILNGNSCEPWLNSFGVFSDSRMRWPILYIAAIFNLLPNFQGCRAFNDLIINYLQPQAWREGSGNPWEMVVHAAVLLHCMNAHLEGAPAPLGFGNVGKPSLKCVWLPRQYDKLDESLQKYISKELGGDSQTILLTIPTNVNFPKADGLLSYGINSSFETRAYQMKRRIRNSPKEAKDDSQIQTKDNQEQAKCSDNKGGNVKVPPKSVKVPPSEGMQLNLDTKADSKAVQLNTKPDDKIAKVEIPRTLPDWIQQGYRIYGGPADKPETQGEWEIMSYGDVIKLLGQSFSSFYPGSLPTLPSKK